MSNATRVVTVKPSAGDYATLSAAISGESKDLVSLTRILEIDLYAMTDTTFVVLTGFTVDSTHYVVLCVPASERHAGVFSSSKYNLALSTNFQNALTISNNYTRIYGVQVGQTGTSSQGNSGSALSISSNNVLVDGAIMFAGGYASSLAPSLSVTGVTATIRNSVIYGGQHSNNAVQLGNFATATLQNCTIVGNAGTAYGVDISSSATATITNTYAGGGATGDFHTAVGTWVMDHSASSDGSATGTGSLTSVALATGSGAKFTNITATTENFHINSGSSLVDVGTSLSGSFTTDIDGDTRSGTWDIGADEIVSASVATTRRKVL